MKNVLKKFEEKLTPIMMKFSSNRYLNVLKNGMVLSIPILIVGSIILVLAELPIQAYQDFMLNSFGENWKWFSGAAVTASMGIAAIIANIGVAANLAKSKGGDSLSAITLSLASFFILLVQLDEGGFKVDDFGAKGLFSALIIAVISTEIYCFIIKKNWTIKMPEGVPPAIAKSFAALIPAAVIMPVFLGVRFIFAMTPYGSANNFILNVLQQPLTGIAATYGGIMVSVFSSHLLWFFGIHGGSIVGAVTRPMYMAASLENLEAFQAGQTLPHIVTQDFSDMFQGAGGVGATLALSIMMIFLCKSQQMRTFGKLTVIPGVFGINEPMVYGLPLVLNPVIAIPFFLAPLLNVTIAYIFMSTGLSNAVTGITIPWTTPPILSGILSTNDFMGGVIQAIGLLISALLYYPFMKILDNKYLAEEERTEFEKQKIVDVEEEITPMIE